MRTRREKKEKENESENRAENAERRQIRGSPIEAEDADQKRRTSKATIRSTEETGVDVEERCTENQERNESWSQQDIKGRSRMKQHGKGEHKESKADKREKKGTNLYWNPDCICIL